MAVTESEALTQYLCEKTFLRRWVIPNPQIDRGKGNVNNRGRELCDAIAVFGDHVLLFSDKKSQLATKGDIEINWQRWSRKAILESAKQLSGAEAWIKKYPHRIFRDPLCLNPISLDNGPHSIIFHRIVIANGAAKLAGGHFGRNHGGFDIYAIRMPENVAGERDIIIGTDPFTIIYPAHFDAFTHVFDEYTFKVVMDEFDTVNDLTDYLLKKENFFRFNQVFCPGEVNLAAYYLRVINEHKEHDFVVQPRLDGYAVDANEFARRLTNSLYLRKKEADKISYNWDNVINYFESLARTQGFEEDQKDTQFEEGMQILAGRRRVERRWLSRSLIDALSKAGHPGQRLVRGHITDGGETAIIFSVLHGYPDWDYGAYRDVQHALMRLYAIQLGRRSPELKRILLLGFESFASARFGNIIMMIIFPHEAPTESEYDDLIEKLRIFQDLETGVHTEKEYPDQQSSGE